MNSSVGRSIATLPTSSLVPGGGTSAISTATERWTDGEREQSFGLNNESAVPSEGGYDATGLPAPVGAAIAALDAVSAWLAPGRQRRVVKVPDFRGLHVSETFLIALETASRSRLFG
jgi:hypothetical protein